MRERPIDRLWQMLAVRSAPALLAAFLLGLGVASIASASILHITMLCGAVAFGCAAGLAIRSRAAVANRAIVKADVAQGTGHPRSTNIHPVTQLATRETLFDAIADTAAPSGTLAVLRFADYDRLAAFDEDKARQALITISKRLVAAIRPGRVLAQIDRDSFGLWFADAADCDHGHAEIRALTYVARQELADIDQMVPSIEIGIACRPHDGHDGDELLKRANGMRSAPEIGSTGEIKLASRLPANVEREIFAIEKALPLAIEGQQLSLAFQPLIDLSARKLVGAEALLRWSHPELGNISPGRFIPIMEQIGLSDTIGMWVLNAACREVRHWQAVGLGDLRVAVNLSARQILDPTLLSKMERTLNRHGIEGSAIELELTETAAMADINYSRQIFAGLREMGVRLSIDDFGSGYSSMSYLQNLPFDKLKIDRAFVTDVHLRSESRAICAAIMALGRGLELEILSEGVETHEELAVLHQLGCRLFQGYYFAKPMTAEAFCNFAKAPLGLPMQRSPVDAQLEQLSKRLSA